MSSQLSSSPSDHCSALELEETLQAVRKLTLQTKSGHYDELSDALGQVRPLWKTFFSYLGTAGVKDLSASSETIKRVIQQNGITYNVYADEQEQSRPWSLNPLPLLIGPKEWKGIATSLQQRAKLLNAILQDVYGKQHLLQDGYLPAALVLGNPGYLRSMHGVTPLGGIYLHVVAFDIARDPEGRWWVIGQRTQSPSGLGYVLENRLIVSRLFPEAYREMRVQHIASSYKRLLDSMKVTAAPLAEGPPRFALLTPGPYSETYFEHAYLARYLGLPLVEGADLTVREDKLYLKTLHGLQQIHGLLRRLDDDFCDPLELRADSSLGVPGLLQAIRAGNVLMANALGTSFLESPAVQGFLPALSERLLGEPLKMPSLNTWWCGERAAWQDISPDLRTQVIKPTYAVDARTNFEPVIAGLLDEKSLNEWRGRIHHQPDLFTTQSYLPFSQAPTWQGSKIDPRTAMLRVYAVAGADGEWSLLPGGMTRIAAGDPHVVSMQKGGSSLDTWVITDQPVDTYSMMPGQEKPPRWDAGEQMVSSRAAENLFWLGRYTERCEAMTRIAKEALVLVSTNRQDSVAVLSDAMAELCENQNLIPNGTPSLTKAATQFGRVLIANMTQSGVFGLSDNLDSLEYALKAVRDRLPSEHVEIANTMRQLLGKKQTGTKRNSRTQERSAIATIEVLDSISIQLAALVGFQSDRMTRDLGWHMLTAGRLIERLINLSEIMTGFFKHEAIYTPRGFETLLVLFDSSITYRTRYQRQKDVPALMDLLINDETNPRAFACILKDLKAQIACLPNGDGLKAMVPQIDPQEETILKLVKMVNELSGLGAKLSDEVSRQFFAHAVERRFAS